MRAGFSSRDPLGNDRRCLVLTLTLYEQFCGRRESVPFNDQRKQKTPNLERGLEGNIQVDRLCCRNAARSVCKPRNQKEQSGSPPAVGLLSTAILRWAKPPQSLGCHPCLVLRSWERQCLPPRAACTATKQQAHHPATAFDQPRVSQPDRLLHSQVKTKGASWTRVGIDWCRTWCIQVCTKRVTLATYSEGIELVCTRTFNACPQSTFCSHDG